MWEFYSLRVTRVPSALGGTTLALASWLPRNTGYSRLRATMVAKTLPYIDCNGTNREKRRFQELTPHWERP
eukprot:jgi/Botrbrau1/8319/Bobra.0081s0008.1